MKYINFKQTIDKLINLDFSNLNTEDLSNLDIINKFYKKYLKKWRKSIYKNNKNFKITKIKKNCYFKISHNSFDGQVRTSEVTNLEFSLNFWNIMRLNYDDQKIINDFNALKEIYMEKILIKNSLINSNLIWQNLIKEIKIVLLIITMRINYKIRNYKRDLKIQRKIIKTATKGQIRT